jgi:hypothetical protein
MFNEGNQIHNFMSSSGAGTVINYGSGSASDFLTSYGSGYGSGSTSQKVTVPTVPVPVPQHCAGTGTFCLSGKETHLGSGTGLGSISNISNTKVKKIIKMRGQLSGKQRCF